MWQFNSHIRNYRFSHFLFLLLCFSISAKAVAIENIETASLQINFQGLNSVHTKVLVNDGVDGSAIGELVKKSYWKNNSTTVEVPQGIYDLVIKKGAGELIIDNVDCRASICTVDNVVSTLTINFPGLNGVHSVVHVSDNIDDLTSGGVVNKQGWQTDKAVLPVLRQVVDLSIRKGGGVIVVDDVDCMSESCIVNDLTASLIVSFPNMSRIHTSVHVVDSIDDSASGEKVTHLNWQKNQAVLTVFRQTYDLKISKNAETIQVDNVDCTSGSCFVNDLTATMNVNFSGLSGVHTSVRLPDDIENSADGAEVTSNNWQKDQVQLTVFKNTYDLQIKKGSSIFIVDRLDCSSGYCLVENLSVNLTVDFKEISAVHVSVHNSDHNPKSVNGGKVTDKKWQKDQAMIALFPGIYDLILRKGDDIIIIDDVNCIDGTCAVNNITAQMTVEFPGLNGMHTTVYKPDNGAGKITGAKVFYKNWQTDKAVLTVFKKKYDVSVKRKKSLPIIIDNLDCTSGACKVDKLIATLTIKFPGMTGMHSSVRNPDSQSDVADGTEFTHKNWQKNQAEITVLRQRYDISVRQKKSEPLVIDNLDCTSGRCVVDQITASLTVKFNGMSSVHTSVLVPDQQLGAAQGQKVTDLNWQKDQASIYVLKQIFDVSVRRGKSEAVVIDNLDCTSGNCIIEDITATMTVNFFGMNGVHTSIQVVDQQPGVVGEREVSKLNWQTNTAIHTVFKQRYDVQVRKGPISKIVDNVDCTSGVCAINELTAVLDINFPGLQSVHSSVHIPDLVDSMADGLLVSKSNWKNHHTSITLLRNSYDVQVKHGVESVFDQVDCSSASCNVLVTGNVQTILINGDLNRPIANKYIKAYEKMPDGKLNKVMFGKTTEQGLINFTLPGLTLGKIYVLKVYDPFGKGKSFFSSFISKEGEHRFVITADGENSLDLSPPEVVISSPLNGANVSDQGFFVTGTVNDNRKIDRLLLNIYDPGKGSSLINVVHDANSSIWNATVPASIISVGSNVVLTVTAFDQAQNKNIAEATVLVVGDVDGPEIIMTSHNDDDVVPVTGFLLSGTVSDLTQVATLNATLIDSVLGETMTNQSVGFSVNSGIWTLVVDNGLMQLNNEQTGEITLIFTATDTVGNSSSKTIRLLVEAVDYSNVHMINRITFGTTPQLISDVEVLGAVGFLEQQLDPENIDNSSFDTSLGSFPGSKEELQVWTLKHMLHSKRQLQEVMTWFWDNHFNTNLNAKRNNAQGLELSNSTQFELDENQAFRNNAFGNFADLLEISAKSPAMLIYLDNISNVSGDSNENYAREVDELHTMGVNGSYTDQDVENGAEIFTGWHVQAGVFSFDASLHTGGAYTMFEGTPEEVVIADGGVIQGEELLNALATHPSTAEFICSKLITLFVNDVPPASLVTRCADEFLDNTAADDQIERVLRLIMLSAEFNDVANYRSKIKTPVEFVVGAVRNLEAASDATDLVSPISSMGIRLYENPVPTGWSEIGADWVNAGLLIERMKWVNAFVRNESALGVSYSNPVQFNMNNNFETAEGIVGFLFQLTVGDDFTELGRNNALDILGIDFDLNNEDAMQKLQNLNGNVLSYPQYQFQ